MNWRETLHHCRIKVRSYECDLYNHVNHSVYLNYLEYARVQMLGDNGVDINEMSTRGIMLVIAEIEIKYYLSAFANDELEIVSTTLESGAAFGVLSQKILRGQELLTLARVKFVSTDKLGRPRRFEQDLRNIFQVTSKAN